MAEKMGSEVGWTCCSSIRYLKTHYRCFGAKHCRRRETHRKPYDLQAIMYNPKIVSHSVQDAALGEGEGCLSVDRNVPGYVVRHARVTVDYFDKDGEKTPYQAQRLQLHRCSA